MTACYLDELGDDRINTITLLNTMVDFTDPGVLGRFTDEAHRRQSSRRRWPSAGTSTATRWPAPSTCCAPTT